MIFYNIKVSWTKTETMFKHDIKIHCKSRVPWIRKSESNELIYENKLWPSHFPLRLKIPSFGSFDLCPKTETSTELIGQQEIKWITAKTMSKKITIYPLFCCDHFPPSFEHGNLPMKKWRRAVETSFVHCWRLYQQKNP